MDVNVVSTKDGLKIKERLDTLQHRASSIFMQSGPFGMTWGAWLVIALGVLVILLLVAYLRK